MAEYGTFRVAGEGDLFRLAVAEYSGNATDALAAHSGKPFSTWDANHDTAPACCPCAPAYSAGWWFYRWVQVPVARVEAPPSWPHGLKAHFAVAAASRPTSTASSTHTRRRTSTTAASSGRVGGATIR